MFKALSGVNASFLGYYLGKNFYPELKDYFIFFIFSDNRKIKDFLSLFNTFSVEKIAYYPSYELPPFSEAYTLSDEEKERLKVLWDLPKLKGICLEAKSFIRKTIPREVLKNSYLYLIPGEKIEREALLQELILFGYERVGTVRNKGEFSIKGAVVELFTPQEEHPVRIEFFGEEILHLKAFDPITQKSFAYLEELVVLPTKELFFPKDTKIIYEKILSMKNQIPEKRISELLQMIENKIIIENSEFLLPLFYENLKPLYENLDNKKILFLLYEKGSILQEIEHYWEKIFKMAEKARAKGKLVFKEELLYLTLEEVNKIFESYPTLEVLELPIKHSYYLTFNLGKISLNPSPSLLDEAFNYLRYHLEDGKEVILFLQEEKNKEVILKGLVERGVEDLNRLNTCIGEVFEGFIWEDKNLVLTSDIELFKKRSLKAQRRDPQRGIKNYFRRFEDLKPGDFVVHKIHGIGKFQGLVMLKVDGFEGEFLEIEYLDGDKLYLPVTRLSELYPYVGVEEKIPQLDKLGKKTFLKRRKEVEKRLSEVVEEILKLYAERKAMEGISIPFNSLAYAQFVQTFPYEETPDQLKAIEEVLEDLTTSKPMDRLLVGDVGFGKTEVALRAIFVTAYAGKQVAVLCPTTLLAEQHFRNFKRRLESFGINVAVLSRLRSEKEQKEVLKGLAEGKIHVVIGTHRLLSKDIEFRDLGLLVIDEEHRFGVKQKERLKQLKKRVKV
ncbi:MAG: DEAD/DEAH box helicase, partial [Caldimicrobium sp.]